jgi:hypothetical protein
VSDPVCGPCESLAREFCGGGTGGHVGVEQGLDVGLRRAELGAASVSREDFLHCGDAEVSSRVSVLRDGASAQQV